MLISVTLFAMGFGYTSETYSLVIIPPIVSILIAILHDYTELDNININ